MDKNEEIMNNIRKGGKKGEKPPIKFANQNLNTYSVWKVLLIIIVFVVGPVALIWRFLFREKLSPQELRKLKKKQVLETKRK